MGQHEIDRENLPYHPEKLGKKEYVSVNDYFSLDIRVGRIIDVEQFPEMKKPSYKIRVDFGPIIGELSVFCLAAIFQVYASVCGCRACRCGRYASAQVRRSRRMCS